MDQKLELLRRVPLFSRLNQKGLETIGQLADEVDVAAGTELCREGRSGDAFYVVIDGTVRIERGGVRVNSLGSGDFLGEIALVDGGPRTATAVTESPTRLLVVGHREFHTLLEDFPGVRLAILEALAERVRRLEPAIPH